MSLVLYSKGVKLLKLGRKPLKVVLLLNTLMFPKLLLLFMIIFQNVPKLNVSQFFKLQEIKCNELFTYESIKCGKDISSKVMIGQLNLISISKLKFTNPFIN